MGVGLIGLGSIHQGGQRPPLWRSLDGNDPHSHDSTVKAERWVCPPTFEVFGLWKTDEGPRSRTKVRKPEIKVTMGA